MKLIEIILQYYLIMGGVSLADEYWNIKNPRPYPKAKYYIVTWEEKDFYKNIYGVYILRPTRKTDNYIKKRIRNQYWKKM